MRFRRMKTGVLFLSGLFVLLTAGINGCASAPPERPDREKIKQDADQGMQDLRREEDRHGNTDGY